MIHFVPMGGIKKSFKKGKSPFQLLAYLQAGELVEQCTALIALWIA